MLFLSISHEEALQRSSEARASGDRETAKKYSNIARDLQRRETSGETSIDYYDTKTGRVRHSEAGSETYVEHMLGTSDRYVPVSEKQVKEVRAYHRDIRDQPELIVPRQTVIRGGEELYTVDPGEQPGTARLTFPGEQPRWTVTYNAGYGEQTREFESEQEAQDFSSSLTTGFEIKSHEMRERGFTLVGDFYEYLKSMGPPQPTEEQRSRIEAGLPSFGIPGPAAGRAPGSIGAELDAVLEKPTKDLFEFLEKPFTQITTPILTLESRLQTASLESASGGKTVLGFSQYVAGVGLGVAIAAFNVATFEVRPKLWIELSKTVSGLAFSPEVRRGVVEGIGKDPFRFTATLVGGAYLGTALKTVEVGQVRTALSKAGTEINKLAKYIPQEDALRGLSPMDKYIVSQPLKYPTFLEGTYLKGEGTVFDPFRDFRGGGDPFSDVSLFLREASAVTKLRPDLAGKITQRLSLIDPFKDFRGGGNPISTITRTLEEAQAITRLRPDIKEMVVARITAIDPLRDFRGGGNPISTITRTLEEAQAITRLRPTKETYVRIPIVKQLVYVESPFDPFKDFRGGGNPFSTATRTLEEAQAITRLRPDIKEMVTLKISGFDPFRDFRGGGNPFSTATRALEEAQAITRLRPPKDIYTDIPISTKRIDVVERYNYEPTFGEQLKAVTAIKQDTLPGRIESFMRSTFGTPTTYKGPTRASKVIQQTIQETSGIDVTKGVYTPAILTTLPSGARAYKATDLKGLTATKPIDQEIPSLKVAIRGMDATLPGVRTVPVTIPSLLPTLDDRVTPFSLDTTISGLGISEVSNIVNIQIPAQDQYLAQVEAQVFRQIQTQVQASAVKRVPPKKKKTKKKKKRKRKVKGAYELRVDKILDDVLKDVKL